MSIGKDQLVDWLIGGIELDTTVLHVGQYCGQWQASTAGRSLASFHLVLHGNCFLHMEERAPVALSARDAVFVLRDMPHFLSPYADRRAAIRRLPMESLRCDAEGSTGLACGFFHFRGASGSLLVDSLPEFLIVRAGDVSLRAAGQLFELIMAEAGGDPQTPSPLITRLVEVLLFYVIRHAAEQRHIASGLLGVARRAEFSRLVDSILRTPGQDWSTESMARTAHMSRANFYKRFVEAGGQPPARFLLRLRMKIAARRLQAGDTVERAAEYVGYRSHAAFSRAFKRVLGEDPGAYRRAHREREQPSWN